MSQDPSRAAAAEAGWAEHLDAVEEWLRRTRDLLEGRVGPEDAVAGPVPSPGPPPTPSVPAALRLRAAAALAGMQRLEQVGHARRARLDRSSAYSRY